MIKYGENQITYTKYIDLSIWNWIAFNKISGITSENRSNFF